MLVKRAPVWSMALKSGKKHFLSSLQPVTLQAAPSCLMTTLLCWEEVKPGCFLFLSTSLPPPPHGDLAPDLLLVWTPQGLRTLYPDAQGHPPLPSTSLSPA